VYLALICIVDDTHW